MFDSRNQLKKCKGFCKGTKCARRDDEVYQRMNANGLSPYDLLF
jgi:hypothetical protein